MNLGLGVSNLGSSPNRKASTWPACRNPLRGFLFLLWWRGCSSLLRQQRECGGVFYRDVGENFAVKIHAGSFQSMNQLPVRDPVQSRSGPNSLYPQPAILPLLNAAITERVTVCAISSFLRRLVQLALGEKKTFCALEIFLSPRTAFSPAFYACHLGFSLNGKQRVAHTRRNTRTATGLSPVELLNRVRSPRGEQSMLLVIGRQ